MLIAVSSFLIDPSIVPIPSGTFDSRYHNVCKHKHVDNNESKLEIVMYEWSCTSRLKLEKP